MVPLAHGSRLQRLRNPYLAAFPDPFIPHFLQTFHDLGLSASTLRAIDALGFEHPTPIQARAIPALLAGDRDVIGIAQTGTGKTAAFALPLIDRIDTSQAQIQALILVPTRELCQQTAAACTSFAAADRRLRIQAVFGGSSVGGQLKALKTTPHLLVATPGRLLDFIERGTVDLSTVHYVVLDEADEMLRMGFREELEAILDRTPADKRTWLFSATMPKAMRRVVERTMRDPVRLEVEQAGQVNTDIEHASVMVHHRDRPEAIMRFAEAEPDMRAVVFCATRAQTTEVAERLQAASFPADALHGGMAQKERDRVMKRFRDGRVGLLIATDVASRGMDVDDLTHVFHYTLPERSEEYTHRSGRTGRAGRTGRSVAFIGARQAWQVKRLEGDLGIRFKHLRVPGVEDILAQRAAAWGVEMITRGAEIEVPEKAMTHAMQALDGLTRDEVVRAALALALDTDTGRSAADINESPSAPKKRFKKGGKTFNKGFKKRSGRSFHKKKGGSKGTKGGAYKGRRHRGEK